MSIWSLSDLPKGFSEQVISYSCYDSCGKPKSKTALTHYRLNELPQIIYWKSLILILGMSGYVI